MNKRMNKRVVDVTNTMHLEPVPGFPVIRVTCWYLLI